MLVSEDQRVTWAQVHSVNGFTSAPCQSARSLDPRLIFHIRRASAPWRAQLSVTGTANSAVDASCPGSADQSFGAETSELDQSR